jgi:hypothetical protein
LVTGLIALIYLLQWRQMPLYLDEVATRVAHARFLADGLVDHGLFGQCPSMSRTIPYLFVPFAWSYSALDDLLGWRGLRVLPIAGMALAIVLLLLVLRARRACAVAPLLLAGLVGVAGSGLVLSRMEAPTLLFGTVCLAGVALVRYPERRVGPAVLYIPVLTAAALFALYIHPQALVFVPIGLLLLLTIALRGNRVITKGLAIAAMAIVLGGAWNATDSLAPRCPESPALESELGRLSLPGLAQQQGWQGVAAYAQGKLARHVGNFLFKGGYDLGYLPGVTAGSQNEAILLSGLNALVAAVVGLNLLLACGVVLFTAWRAVMCAFHGAGGWKQRLERVGRAPASYLFLAASGHLALFVFDVPTNFYRAFYINLVLAAVNALAVSGLAAQARKFFAPAAICTMLCCAASAMVVRDQFSDKFAAGWEGPSISLQTDWSTVAKNVLQLATRCDIVAGQRRVVIDDLTYDALKAHPELVPLTWALVGERGGARDRAESIVFFRRLSATAVIARCKSLTRFELDDVQRSGGLCCAKF